MVPLTLPEEAVAASGVSDELQLRADTRRMWNGEATSQFKHSTPLLVRHRKVRSCGDRGERTMSRLPAHTVEWGNVRTLLTSSTAFSLIRATRNFPFRSVTISPALASSFR